MNNPDHIHESLERMLGLKLKYLNFFRRIRDPRWKNSDLGSGMKKFGSGIRDGKNSDPGSWINNPDPLNCSEATFLVSI
jgi:hypothetical protein